MESKECFSCSELLIDGAHCYACAKDLHYHCAGITEAGYRKLGERKLTWRCQRCKKVGQQILQTDSAVTAPTSPIVASIEQPTAAVLLAEIRSLAIKLVPLESLTQDVKALREEFVNLQASVMLANDAMNDLAARMNKIEERVTQVENTRLNQINSITNRLDKIEEDIRDKDQWSRMNNIEIKGVKQRKDENLFQIIKSIGSKIGYPIQKDAINFVTRVPSRDTNHKPIIACFNNRYVKEDFAAAARITVKEFPLTGLTLNLEGSGNIYINDHLTTHNKILLSKAKRLKNDLGFQYLWVKHCKIFMRANDVSSVICVKSEKDLSKLEKQTAQPV
ncbi:uncharacterized protein ACR2FA_001680 [Aphomia sociella]